MLVAADGSMLGRTPTATALETASSEGLDLVLVNADADPPVCRILDFGRVRYLQRKKQRSSRATVRARMKQLRLTHRTEQHDVQLAVRRARKFLLEKHLVKFNIIFRGRDRNHFQRGRELARLLEEQLADVANLERTPKRESTSLSVMFVPK